MAAKYVYTKYEVFNVVLKYTCPECGAVNKVVLDDDDVYWLLEATLDHNCTNCGHWNELVN